MYVPANDEERKFLEQYDPNKYEKPSVTADIVIFTLSEDNVLSVLLIKRGGYPYKDKWAVPGGFVNIEEDVNMAALRELEEETGLTCIPMEQFQTFGEADRDPRMRVISVAYMAFVPKDTLTIKAGDDAQDAQLFKIGVGLDGLTFTNDETEFGEEDLAFDHASMIKIAIKRLRNRIDYTDDAYKFLKDQQNFTISEFRKIFEAVKGTHLDVGNFRRSFLRDRVDTRKVVPVDKKTVGSGFKAAQLYRRVR